MSAHAYIQYADIPEALLETASRRRDDEFGFDLIAFDGCPIAGEIVGIPESGRAQVEFLWPRISVLRHALEDWFTHHGINFTVVM